MKDRDFDRAIRELVAMGEETDDDGAILRPSYAVKLMALCWRPFKVRLREARRANAA